MSFSVNRVTLLGTLGRDPETRSTASGSEVSNLNLATNEEWKDKESGDWKKKTEWHSVTVWGMTKLVGKLKKGSKVYVEGKLNTRKWQDQEGKDRYTTAVVVQSGGGVLIPYSENNGGGEDVDQTPRPVSKPQQVSKPKPVVQEEMDDSDIPFN